MRGIGDSQINRIHVIENPAIIFVTDRHGDLSARATDLLGTGDDVSAATDCSPNRGPKTRVQNCSGVFTITINTNDRTLAVAANFIWLYTHCR